MTGVFSALRLASWWFVCAFAIASVIVLLDPASADVVQVIARAKGALPSREAVAFVALHAKATRFTAQQRPLWSTMSVGAVATELCGAVEDGYVDTINARNNRNDLRSETVLGAEIWNVAWPACLSALQNVSYTTKQNDTFTSIRLEETGDFAVDAGIASYFANSGIAYRKKTKLPIRMTLKLPFRTLKTLLQLDGVTASDFAAGIGRHVWVDQAPTQGGAVIGAIESTDMSDDTSVDCKPGDDKYPFDAAEVAYAYNFVTSQAGKQAVTINIVDNGFLGLPCDGNGCPIQIGTTLTYDDRFSEDLFPPAQYYLGTSDFVGPTLPLTHIDPITYRIGILQDDIDEKNGHGTYVAGLALGGPSFKDYRATTIETPQEKATIEISIFPIASGTLELQAGADQSIDSYLRSVESPSIVNLSVEFDDQSELGIENSLRQTISTHLQTLFVAAAGNDSANLNNGRYFPAALGGPDLTNVLTVASIDADGRLSSFSNWGAHHVDIAAPGCRIPSWLDADNDPVPLSGTSASAPLTSFGAGLLRSSWLYSSAMLVKNRIVYSGDLITDTDSRSKVYSEAALNIVKALLWKWDFITVSDTAGVLTSYLGSVTPFDGYSCPGVPTGWMNLKSLKRGNNVVAVYQATGGSVKVCEGSFASTIGNAASPNTITFAPLWQLTNSPPYFVPYSGVSILIPAQCVTEIVRADSGSVTLPPATGALPPPQSITCG